MCVTTFEMKCGFQIIEVIVNDICANLKGSHYHSKISFATYKRHIVGVKTMLQCREAFPFVQDETLKVFGATCQHTNNFATSGNADKVLLLSTGPYYLTNLDRPKRYSLVEAFSET